MSRKVLISIIWVVECCMLAICVYAYCCVSYSDTVDYAAENIAVGTVCIDSQCTDAVGCLTDCGDAYLPGLSFSKSQIRDLATLVYLEAGSESLQCQKAVVSVVLNRMTTRNQTFEQVVYAKNQFTPSGLIRYRKPSKTSYKATKYVLKHGPTIPEYVTYFRADYYFNWGNRYKQYKNIDRTYFSYDVKVREAVESQ